MKKILVTLLVMFAAPSAFASWQEYGSTATYTKCKADVNMASVEQSLANKIASSTRYEWKWEWWQQGARDCGQYDGRILFYRWDTSTYGPAPQNNDCSINEAGIPNGGGDCAEPEPTCDAPNYIDDYGECIPPEEVCYTDLLTEETRCVLIGPDDPNDEVPEGCVSDPDSHKEFCVGDEDNGCFMVAGTEYCPEAAEVCGIKNGVFQCVNPMEEGCGQFNGEKVCFDPSGDQVDKTSPDHPDNGGNLDGDETNDVTDSRDPTEGGDPDNQPGPPAPTTDGNRASEQTAQKSLNKLRDIEKGLSGVSSSVNKGFEGITEETNGSEITGGASGIEGTTITALDGYEEGIGDKALDNDAADGVGQSVTNLIDQGSCVDLGFTFKGHSFGLSCDKTQKIRDMLSWVLYFLTVWTLFDIVTTPATRKT